MAKKKLYKSKTNFTLRRLHQSGTYGTIYERDYTTVTNFPSNDNGQLSIYASPSFKLTIRPGSNGQKKYRHGDWLINPNSCTSDNTNWTLNCLPEPNKTDSKIVLKPNSRRLTDFACYASSYELIKSAITNIIKNFPAEIYVTETKLESTKIFEVNPELESTEFAKYRNYYIAKNPLNIDIIQSVIPEDNELSPLRFLCESEDYYRLLNELDFRDTVDLVEPLTTVAPVTTPAPQTPTTTVAPEGVLKFWDPILMPDKKCLNNGDILAKVMFNKELEIICVYYENSIVYLGNKKGYRIRPKQEVINEFFENLNDFEKVLLNPQTKYSSIFETYEETDEDGWVMYEKTYKWPIDEGNWNISTEGAMFNEYINELSKLALIYDELYTDSIWRDMTHEAITNMDLTINRNGEDTVLDSSKMKKLLNIIGRQFDEIKKYADNIKKVNSITYTQDGNTPDYFLSDNLDLSGWETKKILNEIPNDIITPSLYGAHTTGFTAGDANNEFMRRLQLNSKQILAEKGTKRCIEDLMALFGYHSTDWLKKYYGNLNNVDLTKAFTILEYVYVAKGYAYEDIDTGIKPEEMHTLVYNMNTRKDGYINDDSENSEIDLYQGLPVTDVTYIIYDEQGNPQETTRLIPWVDKSKKYDSDLYFQMKGGWARNDGDNKTDKPVYDYTISKIHYVPTVEDLYDLLYYTLDKTGVYYVGNIDEYYRLIDETKHTNKDGWVKIDKNDDIIKKIENITDNNKGNNPHTGEYDSGIEFCESFGNLFKYSKFTNTRYDETKNNIFYGFNINKQTDSTKCLFVSDTTDIVNDDAMLRGKNKIQPYNFFTGEFDKVKYTEADSLSVINSKELHIVFADEHRTFLEKNVLPYVKQIIPSTAIFSYSFEKIDAESAIFKAQNKNIICDGEICAIYGITE